MRYCMLLLRMSHRLLLLLLLLRVLVLHVCKRIELLLRDRFVVLLRNCLAQVLLVLRVLKRLLLLLHSLHGGGEGPPEAAAPQVLECGSGHGG